MEPKYAVWVLSEFNGIDVFAATARMRANNITYPDSHQLTEFRLSGYHVRYDGGYRHCFVVAASVRSLIQVAIWAPDRQDITVERDLDRFTLSPNCTNDGCADVR